MVTKPAVAHKCIKVTYITNIVIILHVLATTHGYIKILQKCVYRHTHVNCHFYLPVYYIITYTHGPGVDSAANRNEYQVYFLGVKAAGA